MKKQVLVLCFFIMTAVSLMAQNAIDKEVQKAVNELAGRVISPIKVNIKEITQSGTKDMTSELSVYLYSLIKHYTVNSSMFIVEEIKHGPRDLNGPSIGIISGTYNTRGKTVEVILELKVDEKVRRSARFSISVSEIEKLGISLVPENFNNQNDAVKQDKNIATVTEIIKPPKNNNTQGLQIQAWFDSQLGNRVFLHREAPDKIQFAIYNLDKVNPGNKGGVKTRGAGHTFSFDKPQNITQAVQIVRSSILDKGGIFDGNEQYGSFKVNGIEGRYIVTEKINVTITEKPFLIPNSLIEREVKNYFGK